MSAVDLDDHVGDIANVSGRLLESIRGVAAMVARDAADLPGPGLMRTRKALAATARELEEALTLAHEAGTTCEQAFARWQAGHRYTPEGLQVTVETLAAAEAESAGTRRRLLLAELAAAARHLAVDRILDLVHAFPDWLSLPGSTDSDLAAWQGGDLARGRDAVRALAALAGDERRPRVTATTKLLGLTEAWLSHELGDSAAAAAMLDRLVDGAPNDPTLRAERSGLRLLLGDKEGAVDDAHSAIEIDHAGAECYVQAGALAEVSGEYADADDLYEDAVERLVPVADVGPEPASFIQRTGRFHLVRARWLWRSGAAREALSAAEFAVATGVTGTRTYPEADAWDLEWRIHQELGTPAEALAPLAFEAGRRHLWNESFDEAAEALRVAVDGGSAVPAAGWYLADTLLQASRGRIEDHLLEAADVWDRWFDRTGPPSPEDAWTYADRALVDEFLASARGEDIAPVAWAGVLRCEKGLIVDPRSTSCWGVLSRFFRQLSFTQLALDAVESGYELNPNDRSVLEERTAVLTDLGPPEQALTTLDRISDADKNPWLSGIRALLLLELDRPEDAIRYLDLPLSEGWDLGWYRDVLATCLVDLGRLDEALDELRGVLRESAPHSGQGRSRRVYALSILGDLPAAEAELAVTLEDDSLSDEQKALAALWVALGRHDLDLAVDRLGAVLAGLSRSFHVTELDREVEHALRLLAHAGRPVPDADGFRHRVNLAVEAWTPAPESPELDLDRAERLLADEPAESLPRMALLAVRARRLARSDRRLDAAELYEQALKGPLEPEVSTALTRVLNEELVADIERGDVAATSSIYARLADLGRPPRPYLEVAVAEAQRAGGDHLAAVRTLSGLLPTVQEPAERLPVLELLGEAALFAGVPAEAEAPLTEAVKLAVLAGEASRAAQLSVRIALALALTGAWVPALNHLMVALREWTNADTWDPLGIMTHELRSLVDEVPALTDADRTRLEGAVEELAKADATGAARGVAGDADRSQEDR